MHHGTMIVLAWDVLRGEHCNDTRRRAYATQVDFAQARMRTLADADRRMQ